MSRDPNDKAYGDFRLHNIFLIEAIDGVPFESHGVQTSMSQTGADYTGFAAPSSAALHLNSAWKAARRAAISKRRVDWNVVPARFTPHGPGEKARRQVDDSSTEALFDFFEDAMIAASSSFYAVEAFCNVTLAERGTAPYVITRKGKKDTFTLEEMERRVSTDDKLKRVVPDLLGVPSPATKAVWQGYQRMQALRDRFTHFKRRDIAGMGFEPTALHDLLAIEPFEHPEAAMAIIGYFFKSSPAPRWLRNPTWTR